VDRMRLPVQPAHRGEHPRGRICRVGLATRDLSESGTAGASARDRLSCHL